MSDSISSGTELTAGQRAKLAALESFFGAAGRVAVAFSGGVDSALLFYLAGKKLGSGAVGVIGVSPSLPLFELEEAEQFAKEFGLNLHKLETKELDDENYASNPSNRCYFCKSELFDKLWDYADANGISVVVDGTNTSELGGHRPGHAAGTERKVSVPFVEAGCTKEDIRAISQSLGLPTWNKPSFACLSSRFPTGTAINESRLSKVGAAETALYRLGFKTFRVRFHDEVARIELDEEGMARLVSNRALRHEVDEMIKKSGFKFVTLDLLEYKTGRLSAAYQHGE